MSKFITYLLFAIAGFALASFLCKGCGDKPKTNKTDNIDVVDDSLKIIQNYPRQIAEKESVIMDLQAAIVALEKQSQEKGDLSDELAAKIKRREAEIKRLGGEIQSLLFIVSNTKVTTTAPIEETPRTDETGVEVGGDPVYYSIFRDSNEWYNAAVYFDLVSREGMMNLVVKDEYSVIDYTGKDGVSYLRIENANPYVTAQNGTNLFKKPVTLPARPKLNLLAALYGRSTDGREQYSLLYGRRLLKQGKVFVQGVYSDRELSGMAGLGLNF